MRNGAVDGGGVHGLAIAGGAVGANIENGFRGGGWGWHFGKRGVTDSGGGKGKGGELKQITAIEVFHGAEMVAGWMVGWA